MAEKMTLAEMIGEGLRELGILALLFIPLDYAFSDSTIESTWAFALTAAAIGGGLFAAGVVVELRRR